MLGTRTKQVNSYGRRGSRIVNVSDRQNSDVDAPPPRPLRRENAIIISPAKSRVGLRKLKGSARSPLNSPLNAAKRALQPKLQHTRQPLTPVRANGTSPTIKTKESAVKPLRASLKPHPSVIPVDIVVFDADGNTLTQERRLSHTDTQANQVHTAAGRGRKIPRGSSPSPPPIDISDDSDAESVLPKPVAKRSNLKSRPIVISSDESDTDDKRAVYKKLPGAQSSSKSKSLRVEVVIPRTAAPPFQKSKVLKTPSSPPSLDSPPRIIPIPKAPVLQARPSAVPSILAPPIPVAKPRQLTPIRSRPTRSALPPTPSTLTEADLSLEFAHLDLCDIAEIAGSKSTQPEYLLPLLDECAQASPYEFSAFIETFPFDPIVQSSADHEDVKFRKIGEASYSEVFGIGDVVLKIIPIQSEGDPDMAEIPAPSDAKDILKEIVVTREIGGICNKFVKLLKTYVVRGRYPSLLLDLWDEYNERKGSESIRPDSFGLRQVYAIIILPNGGPDLESFTFKNVLKSGWHQACGIFWQVARALEQAEQLGNFEHRDLHWGQILVKSLPVKRSSSKIPTSRTAMDDTRFGVKVTIIDLGLSRMYSGNAPNSKIYWTPFDNEIFEGEGDYQYDIYRMMRDHIGSAWKSYHPFTNVMWLHYLADKLLHEKRLKHPGGKKQILGETGVVLATGYDEQECYNCLAEMEKLLNKCIVSARKGQKARRKTGTGGLGSAGDIIAYGMRRGWVQ